MPRIPKVADLSSVHLDTSSRPAQIDERVAEATGRAGRAWGDAIAAVGGAFGEIAGRMQDANDATLVSKAKLDWMDFTNTSWNNLQQNAGEDGAGWQNTVPTFKSGYEQFKSNYIDKISDPKKREALDFQLQSDVAKYGFQGARNYQVGQAGTFDKDLNNRLDGAHQKLTENPSQELYESYSQGLNEYADAGRGKWMDQATVDARKKQIQERLFMGLYTGLKLTDPEKADELLGKIRAGKTVIDPNSSFAQPGASDPEAMGGVAGQPRSPVSGKRFPIPGMRPEDVPRSGGAENSREHGGPRGGGRHAGWDVPGKVGDPVEATGEGVVLKSGNGQGYGDYVDVKYADGTIHRYAHLGDAEKGGQVAGIADGIQQGTKVSPGMRLGAVGYSGNAGKDFPHLHLEVFPNQQAYERAQGQSSRESWNLRISPREYFSGAGGQAVAAQGGQAPDIAPQSADDFIKAQGFNPDNAVAGVRNNNPFNMKYSGSSYQRRMYVGMEGPSENTDQGTPQIKFNSPEAGLVSGVRLVLDKADGGKDTVASMIAGRGGLTSDGSKNNRLGNNAAAAIASRMGVDPDQQIDFRDPKVLASFTKEYLRQEHGEWSSVYSDQMIAGAIGKATGQQQPQQAQQNVPLQNRTLTRYASLEPNAGAPSGGPDPSMRLPATSADQAQPGQDQQQGQPDTIGLARRQLMAMYPGTDVDKLMDANGRIDLGQASPESRQKMTDTLNGLGIAHTANDDGSLTISQAGGQAAAQIAQSPQAQQYAAQIHDLARTNPTQKLTDAIDDHQLDALMDARPDLADRLGDMTVKDASMLLGQLQGHQRKPGQEFPRGPFEPGQVFEVNGKNGPIRVRSEDVNAITPKALQKLDRDVKEAIVIRQREGESQAQDMMQKQLLTVERTGKDHSQYDPAMIADVYRRSPEKVRQFNQRLEVARMVHEAVGDASNMHNDQLESRLMDLQSRVQDANGDADPEVAKALDRAEKKVALAMKQRTADPGAAVQNSREVQAVIAKMPAGEPKTPADEYSIADARMKAQVRLGLAPSPITRAQADAIVNPITFAQTPKEKRAAAEATVKKLSETYGDLAPQALSAAVRLSRGDRDEDRSTLDSAFKRMQRGTQGTIQQIDKATGWGWSWPSIEEQQRAVGPSAPQVSPSNPYRVIDGNKEKVGKAWDKAWSTAPR